MTDSFTQGRGPDDNAPGWYPDRIAPNLQKYWDGNAWIAQRRWVGGKWVSEPPPGMAPDASAAVSAADGYRGFAAGPAVATTSRPVNAPTVSFGAIGLLVSCVMVIVGSFTPWVTVSIASLSVSANGTDSGISDAIGVNGWIIFAGALLLFILVCLSTINPAPLFRSLILILALVVTGFAVYDLVRILQKISQAQHPSFNGAAIKALSANASVAWRLIVVVIGAVGTLLFAFIEYRSN